MSHGVMDFDILGFFGQRGEHARLMRRSDVIPAELEAGFDVLGQLDPDWVWVLEEGTRITGVLVASPAHGTAMLWRISISKQASRVSLVRLLRAFLRDSRSRGIRGYLTVVSLDNKSQSQLARIIERSGGKVIQSGMTMLASSMPREVL